MKRYVAALMVMASAWVMPAHGTSLWPLDTPLPQDALLSASMRTILDKREDIQQAMVVVQMGHGEENPRWMMSQTQLQVFLNKLMAMPGKPLPEDDIWPKLKAADKSYTGVTVVMQTVDGKRFEPVKIFEGRVSDPRKALISPDFGRQLEYWMFGTARVRRDQLLGVSVLPVLSFEQCRLLGQKIVETSPRQCLLPDNNLLLETTELPTLKSAKLRDFDGCLKEGKALIYTFPRRCIAAGGRVFTEPPRVYEATPADAPLATVPPLKGDVSASMGGLKALILQSMVTPTQVIVSGSLVSGTLVSGTVVSGTQVLSDADLAKIMPAAGPERGYSPLRWLRSVWKYEWADFGER